MLCHKCSVERVSRTSLLEEQSYFLKMVCNIYIENENIFSHRIGYHMILLCNDRFCLLFSLNIFYFQLHSHIQNQT